jgi:hypothetical protein
MLWSLVLWSSDRGVLISRRWFTRRYRGKWHDAMMTMTIKPVFRAKTRRTGFFDNFFTT